jgi:hypothetical protein
MNTLRVEGLNRPNLGSWKLLLPLKQLELFAVLIEFGVEV